MFWNVWKYLSKTRRNGWNRYVGIPGAINCTRGTSSSLSLEAEIRPRGALESPPVGCRRACTWGSCGSDSDRWQKFHTAAACWLAGWLVVGPFSFFSALSEDHRRRWPLLGWDCRICATWWTDSCLLTTGSSSSAINDRRLGGLCNLVVVVGMSKCTEANRSISQIIVLGDWLGRHGIVYSPASDEHSSLGGFQNACTGDGHWLQIVNCGGRADSKAMKLI